MTLGIVGVGLIGGSLAMAARAAGYEVVGYDASERNRARALELGLIDACHASTTLAQRCDLVAVAVPVGVAPAVCAELLDADGAATVFELGSTKGVFAERLDDHPARQRLVLTHPMAGTEFSGPEAAVAGLFRDRTVVFCDVDRSGDGPLAQVRALYEAIGMRVTTQASGPHDLHVAYVSHISHISSFALSLTVLEKERDERQIFGADGFD